MANSYFQFKQFLVRQKLCAMKVCTDSCLFGAVVANTHKDLPLAVLDIGTGSGLLSLMLAQQLPTAKIDAVELDAQAFQQSQINFSNSSFSTQLTSHHISIQDYMVGKSPSYDLVICNPPFFTNHLKAETLGKNQAKHNDSLSPTDLASAVAKLLHNHGTFWILLPVSEAPFFIEKMLEKGLYIQSKYEIFDTPNSDAFRWIMSFSKQNNHNFFRHQICIKQKDQNYSATFVQLLKPYYLNL